MPPVQIAFDRTNPLAQRWAEERSAWLLRHVSEGTRAAVRTVVGRAFDEGLPPRASAVLVRDLVGLLPQHADAVLAARARLAGAPGGRTVFLGSGATETRVRVPAEGLSAAELEEAVGRYADALLDWRAEAIARSETLAASNEGQRELWEQAREEGLLEGDEEREWLYEAGLDEKPCPICAPLDGQRVALDEPWVTEDGEEVMNPPAHPHCRCGQGLRFPRAERAARARTLAEFDESQHPRDEKGQFTESGGGGLPSSKETTFGNGVTTAAADVLTKVEKQREETYRTQVLAYRGDESLDAEAKAFIEEHPDFETYAMALEDAQQELVQNSEPAMAVPLQRLVGAIAQDGEFRNTFLTGRTGARAKGETYRGIRAETEAMLFSIPEGAPGDSRPTYGFLLDKNDAAGHAGRFTEQYGDAIVVFHDAVRERMTFTENDSLDSRGFRLPSLATAPSHVSTFPGYTVGDHMRAVSTRRPDSSSMFYHEAQYHGRLGLRDVARVYLRREPSARAGARLSSLAETHGWQVVELWH